MIRNILIITIELLSIYFKCCSYHFKVILNYLKEADGFLSTHETVMHFLTNTNDARKELFLTLVQSFLINFFL